VGTSETKEDEGLRQGRDQMELEYRAQAKHVPMSPRKVRLVVDVVRGLDVDDALNSLRFMPQAAVVPVTKLINSAVANAEENFGAERENLYISKIYADGGPRHRLAPYGGRFGGRGRFKPIIKRSCHITVVLSEHAE
jgi:large subunit ribosomal protein L22